MTSPGNGGPPRRTPRQPWNKHRELSHAQAHLDPSLGQGTEYSDHILACRDMPADRMLHQVSTRAPDGFDRIEDVLSPTELRAFDNAYRATTLQDVAELNARASLSP